MLQQTQVKTVLPYYRRWVKRFPNIQTLSHASLSQVLKLWEGLGYYSRARNLHRAAKFIVEKLDGKFPDSCEALRELPGVGRYTAGAIASIAFGKPEPIVDGNVKRVLSRIFALKEPVDTSRGEGKLWEIAKNLLRHCPTGAIPILTKKHYGGDCEAATPAKPKQSSRLLRRPYGAPRNDGHYGDFNQSLMELGALVCLPENPRCGVCPLEKRCKAHRLGEEENFPVKSRKEKVTELRTVAAVIWKNGRVLLKREPLNGRWGGLWTFPHWICTDGSSEKEFLKNRIRREFGVGVVNLRPWTDLKHGFTRYKVRLRVFEGEVHSQNGRLRWIEAGSLSRFPLPRPHQRIAQLVQTDASGTAR